jgi:hypothetical protein
LARAIPHRLIPFAEEDKSKKAEKTGKDGKGAPLSSLLHLISYPPSSFLYLVRTSLPCLTLTAAPLRVVVVAGDAAK